MKQLGGIAVDIRVLKYFLTVVREENITKASEILHITQPTLSRQLAKLEEDLGVQLFIRGKKGISLTDEGVLFRRRASEIVELADKAEKELTENEQLVNGEISVGTGECEAVGEMLKLFALFKEKYPNVYLDIYTGNADHIKRCIDNGLVDLGILIEPVEIEKYDFIRLNVAEEWVVLMRCDSPLAEKEYITIDDLSKYSLIFPKRQSTRNEIESWFRNSEQKPKLAAYSNLSTNAAVLVEQGLGYALIIKGSLPFLNHSKVTYRSLYPQRKTTCVLAWKKHQPFSQTVTKFINHIQCNLCMDNDEI